MIEKKDYILNDNNKCITIYNDNTKLSNAWILYFHGGGLLYGKRKDLPEYHIEKLSQNGYTIITCDYPLAPSDKIDIILSECIDTINEITQNYDKYNLTKKPYFLWGRSAGAYLSLLSSINPDLKVSPTGIISYYGYGFLIDGWYEYPSQYYNSFPAVTNDKIKNLDKSYASSLQERYSVYVYARQHGKWKDMIYTGRDKFFYKDYTLKLADKLPCPLFCAHSINDPDVPYLEFLALVEKYKAKKYIAISDIHDFDRDISSPFTIELLDMTIDFLNDCIH